MIRNLFILIISCYCLWPLPTEATIKLRSVLNNFSTVDVQHDREGVTVNTLMTVMPQTVSGIRAPIGGEIVYIPEVGANLSKGDTLLKISTQYILERKEKLSRTLEITSQKITNKQSQIERRQELVKKNIITQESFNTLQTELAVLQEERKAIRSDIKLLKYDLENASITSKFDGIVTERQATVGEFIQKNGAVLSFTATNKKESHIKLPLERYSLFNINQDYTITVGDNKYTVRLLKKSPLDTSSGQFFLAIFEPDEAFMDEFTIGQKAVIEINSNTSKDTYTFPSDALQIGFEGAHVYTIDGDQAKKLLIKHYWQDGESIVTFDPRLKSQTLIVSEQKLIDGQKIQTKPN